MYIIRRWNSEDSAFVQQYAVFKEKQKNKNDVWQTKQHQQQRFFLSSFLWTSVLSLSCVNVCVRVYECCYSTFFFVRFSLIASYSSSSSSLVRHDIVVLFTVVFIIIIINILYSSIYFWSLSFLLFFFFFFPFYNIYYTMWKRNEIFFSSFKCEWIMHG